MEKKMEHEMETLGPFKGVYKDIIGIIMENQMEKKMVNEMEAGIIQGYIWDYKSHSLNSYYPL